MVARRYLLAVVGCVWICLAIGGSNADDSPIGRGVGGRVANFSLPDVRTGKPVSLHDFAGKKAAVIVFCGVDCPVGNLYMPRLVELEKAYRAKDVVFLTINSNAHESAQQVAEHARSYHVEFPVLKDAGNVVADQLFAERTCEALVLDGRATLRFRGAIDDQYGAGVRKEKPSKSYLTEALDSLLAGKAIDTTATTVVGCPIDRVEPVIAQSKAKRVRAAPPVIIEALRAVEPPVQVGQVSFAKDVATIIQDKCQSCHRPDQVAPFSLRNYDDTKRWASSIREVVDERRMPPWHADPRFGHFENNRSLSARDRATLLAWIEQGTPLGDPKDLPPPKAFPEGWAVGEPDLVFQIPETFTVPAQGVLPYQYFRVPTGFTEDKWVQSLEPRPGDRSVVHHIIVYLDDKKPNANRRGMREHLAGYAPGDMPSVYPPGTAKLIPAGSDLVFQLHYTPNGKVKTDRSKVGLIFAKTPPKHRAITLGIPNLGFKIPPGDDSHEVKSRFRFPVDSHLLAFMPHMHLRGKDFLYTAVYPDGRSETLLSVPAYDFGWQSYYRYVEPKAMPKGTVINCVAHFDNSKNNPVNPDPTKEVRWGEQTWEEMMIGYIDFVTDATIDTQPKQEKAADEKAASARGTDAGVGTAAKAIATRLLRQAGNAPRANQP